MRLVVAWAVFVVPVLFAQWLLDLWNWRAIAFMIVTVIAAEISDILWRGMK